MVRAGVGGRSWRLAAAGLCLGLLAGCARDPVSMTECVGNRPAVERLVDVSPPNCDPVLPGSPQRQADAPLAG